jgi:CDP-glucose 4,6-dehydratase
MNPDYWRGRRVFITGHTGFKGGWLSLWLQNLGAEVYGFALEPSTRPSLFNLADVASGMHSTIGDIRDIAILLKAMNEASPEVVIHMAAQPLVLKSYQNPIETYSINIMGTVNLLECVRNCKSVKAVVNVTTDKCYENKEWVWSYRENETLGGYDPYSNSKACSEMITASYRSSFFNENDYSKHSVAIASARAGNVIGGGDWSENRLVPDILNAFEKNLPIQVRNPKAIRPWQHVLEPLCGYLQLAEKLAICGPKFAGAWNFGPNSNDVKNVQTIVEEVCKLWGPCKGWLAASGKSPHEANYLKLDTSKAQSELGWQPKLNLSETLEMIVSWHKSYVNLENLRQKTLEQINFYESIN